MKKLTLAVLTALALTATISNTAEAKTYKSPGSIDKVSKQLYKTNLKSHKDKTKTLILNKKTYNKLKRSGRWKGLSGIKSMKSYVKKKYPGVPSSKIQAKCKFSVNYKKSANNGRYRVTLTISDELARVWWMDTHPDDDFDYSDGLSDDDYAPFPMPTETPDTPNETPMETPTEKPQTPEAIAKETKEYLDQDWGKDVADEMIRQIQERIDKHEKLYERPASDFQKAAIIAGWVDEHVDYGSSLEEQDILTEKYIGDCNTFSCMNADLGRCFGLDVTSWSGGNHRWNIITINGVRYEYDATDVGVDAMAFFEISHGQQAEYNVEKYGGKVAKITGIDIERAVTEYTRAQGYNTYYIMDARTPEYTLHDVYVPGKYYYAVSQYKVSDTIKSKPDIQFGATVISTPELSDDRLMEYLEMY